MSNPNCEYIYKNYMLPKQFNHNDIDWLRYYPMKDKKIYEYNSKRTLEKSGFGFNNYIYNDEKVIIYNIFVKYLAYINNIVLKNDIINEEMNKLLSIKICDYDWLFMWSNLIYDKNSEELLLQKINNDIMSIQGQKKLLINLYDFSKYYHIFLFIVI